MAVNFDDESTGVSYQQYPKDPLAREQIQILDSKVEQLKEKTVSKQEIIDIETKVRQSDLDKENFKIAVNKELTDVKNVVEGIDGGNVEKNAEIEAAVSLKANKDVVDSLLNQIEGSIKQINGRTPDEEGNVIIDVNTEGLATKQEVTAKTDELAELVFSKAEKADVETLVTQVASKASTQSVTQLTSQLAKTPNSIDIMLSGTRQAYAAHRGLSLIAPENTIPAYEMASKHGFVFAETDIQITADGEIVLMHDLTVDRTTNGTGVVSSLTLAQIRSFTIDAGQNIEQYPNLKVPTLDEFLNTMIETGMYPLMEMKTFDYMEKLIKAIKDKGLESKSIVMISKEMMPAFRLLSKKITLAMLTDDIGNVPYLADIGNTIIIMHYASVTPEKVVIAHKSGIPVANWGSFNYQHLQNMADSKVDINITDGTMLGGRN